MLRLPPAYPAAGLSDILPGGIHGDPGAGTPVSRFAMCILDIRRGRDPDSRPARFVTRSFRSFITRPLPVSITHFITRYTMKTGQQRAVNPAVNRVSQAIAGSSRQ